jgi:glucodextranase-like protein/PASTA domain-containing protein
MRAPTIAAVFALTALAAACGDDPAPPREEPRVKLELGSPDDGEVVRSETVELRGTVLPRGARVKVAGREVAVDGGSFRTEVPLEPGANLIDVAAERPGRRPDFAVARVVREVRLPVPDVTGSDADNAQDQLEGLGLTVLREDGGGFFDPLLPGDPKVCEQEPRPGVQVLPGSEVVLLVARDC